MSYDEDMDETAGGVGDVSNEVDTFDAFNPDTSAPPGFDPTRSGSTSDLDQANKEAMAAVDAAQLGGSPLSKDYGEYALGLDLDYGRTIDDKGGMSKIFDRGVISNLFAGPKGFDKYAGKDLPSTTHGGFIESIVESLVYLATMGMIDPELSGYDMIGPDMSGLLSGRPQPQGVQIGLPGSAGLLSFISPELTFDAKNQTAGLTGGVLSAIDKAAQFANLTPKDENLTQDMLALSTVSPTQTTPSITTPSVTTQIAGTPSGTPNPNNLFSEDDSISELSSLSPSQAAATTGVAALPVDLDQEPNVYSGLLGGTSTIEDRDIFGFAAAQGGEVKKFNSGGLSSYISDPRVRMYLEQFTFGGKPEDITNKNIKEYFSEKELKILEDVVKRKGSDEGTIKYDDYFDLPLDVRTGKRKPTDTELKQYQKDFKKTQTLRDTLGGFSFEKNPDTGEVIVKDVYDWGKEYGETGHTGDDSTMGIAKGGRNVTGFETIKGLPKRSIKKSLEMFANAYGPREINDNPETQTIVDVLGIRPKPRKINYKFNVGEDEATEEVLKFSPGGVAGLMGRRPSFGLGNDVGRLNQQQLDLMRQRQLSALGGLFQPKATSNSFPGFMGGLGGTPRPPFPQQRQPLNPETYYHTHEKGEVDYPNFPKQIQPKNPRRLGKPSITDPIKPQPVLEQKVDPYVQPEFIQQDTTQQIAESVTPATPEAELPATPVTPVSSPTEATVVESPAQQINPEEGLSSMMQDKEINISMPSNLTATIEFPEQLTGTVNAKSGGHVQNYNLGGIAQLLAPAIAGFAGTPLGLLGSAGLGAAAGYGLAGRRRSFSDAIKGAMLGVAGGGLGQVAGAGPSGIKASGGFDFLPSSAVTAPATGSTAFQGYTQGLSNAFSGLGSLDMAGLKSAAVPLATGLMGATITTPAEMPNMAAQPGMQLPKAKTEEERRQMAYRGLSPFTAQSFVPPTIYAAARGGEVPEKETLEEGSFVVPADVVSNIGDGNTSSGFAKLDKMFGKENSDYALGGPIKGPTGGLDDLRQTTIAGEQAAALSDGEYVVSKGDVMRLGDGSNKKGAEKLYAMMDQVRMSKHGTTKQPENSITMQGLRSMMG
jgi:hypothetical protein